MNGYKTPLSPLAALASGMRGAFRFRTPERAMFLPPPKPVTVQGRSNKAPKVDKATKKPHAKRKAESRSRNRIAAESRRRNRAA